MKANKQIYYGQELRLKRRVLTFVISIGPLLTYATNYYVNPVGNDSNDGLTVATAFQSLNYAAAQTAADDTVFVMNGTYTNASSMSNVLDIYNSGTANSGIVFRNYPGHSPLIKINENNWSGIAIQGADYITIDGFEIVGNNDAISLAYALEEQLNTNNPGTSANGIGITREYSDNSNKPHHNVIRNCKISKCGGAGIYTYRADYTTIENNTIFECAWYSPYGNSGISLYQNWNSDSLNIVRNFVVGNTCYRNQNYVPFVYVGSITDGNGIIIDDGRNTQNNSTQGVYIGKTYVANNLIFDNGGRGIHVYLSDKVLIVNNTCFQNCQSPAIHDGELTAYDADSVFFINNIAHCSDNIPPIDHNTITTTNLIVDHNLWGNNSVLASPMGTNTVIGDPDFILPSAVADDADFRLLPTSSAIDAGTASYAPMGDKDGSIRLSTDSVDIGCYEYHMTSTVEHLFNKSTLEVFPNPTSSTITVHGSFANQQLEISIFESTGRFIRKVNKQANLGMITIDISDLQAGLYYLIAHDDKRIYQTTNVLKCSY